MRGREIRGVPASMADKEGTLDAVLKEAVDLVNTTLALLLLGLGRFLGLWRTVRTRLPLGICMLVLGLAVARGVFRFLVICVGVHNPSLLDSWCACKCKRLGLLILVLLVRWVAKSGWFLV